MISDLGFLEEQKLISSDLQAEKQAAPPQLHTYFCVPSGKTREAHQLSKNSTNPKKDYEFNYALL